MSEYCTNRIIPTSAERSACCARGRAHSCVIYRFQCPPISALLAGVKVDLGIWDKLTRLVIFLLFVSGLLVVAIWYLPLIKHNERMRKEILRLDTQIEKEAEKGRKLKTSIDALRYDPKAVERLARERLGYAKVGETVIRFAEPATNAAPRR